ncbi:uncharacterized protein LOC113357504 isoform X2 [Papaver somniferum]|uniref:uncharacterized protein LOC113357504 isoform X2 n=1 Tax=Papaver somniferum TaxID=3469 RepID=UPI000E704A79|nr:uncharacterized protein LOC113357504 isoform X2 [Papaver somniferum]
MKEFNILTPLLEVLEIDTNGCRHRDLEYCEFKIHAPLLVSLICSGVVAKDYVLMCSFLVLDYAEVSFTISDDESGRWEQRISHVIRKFVGALSRVRQLSLSLSVSRTEVDHLCDDDKECDKSEELFRHFQSVRFVEFIGRRRESR